MHGRITVTSLLDDLGSTLSVIKTVRGEVVVKTFEKRCLQDKVHNAREEMALYLKHSERIREKRKQGVLLVRDDDPTLLPSFTAKYPKKDIDGSYIVESSWTEIVQT